MYLCVHVKEVYFYPEKKYPQASSKGDALKVCKAAVNTQNKKVVEGERYCLGAVSEKCNQAY
jgi:hypothetical protein